MLRSKLKNYCSKHFGIPCTDPVTLPSKHESEADEYDDDDDGNVEDEEIFNRVDAAWFQGRSRF